MSLYVGKSITYNMILQTWADVLTRSLYDLWLGIVNFVPNLIVALVIFAIGWLVRDIPSEHLYVTRIDAAT